MKEFPKVVTHRLPDRGAPYGSCQQAKGAPASLHKCPHTHTSNLFTAALGRHLLSLKVRSVLFPEVPRLYKFSHFKKKKFFKMLSSLGRLSKTYFTAKMGAVYGKWSKTAI